MISLHCNWKYICQHHWTDCFYKTLNYHLSKIAQRLNIKITCSGYSKESVGGGVFVIWRTCMLLEKYYRGLRPWMWRTGMLHSKLRTGGTEILSSETWIGLWFPIWIEYYTESLFTVYLTNEQIEVELQVTYRIVSQHNCHHIALNASWRKVQNYQGINFWLCQIISINKKLNVDKEILAKIHNIYRL